MIPKGTSRERTRVVFESADRGKTYYIRIKAHVEYEPWSLYDSLQQQRFIMAEATAVKDPDGYVEHVFIKSGQGPDRQWTLGNRRAYMRQAIGVLRQFGFENVAKQNATRTPLSSTTARRRVRRAS